MNTLEVRTIDNGGEPVLWIPGSTFEFSQYVPLAESLPGEHVLINNPFHSVEQRPDDWEQQLIGMQSELYDQRGCTEIAAHSRGVLQAGTIAIQKNAGECRNAVKRLFLLHPPVHPTTINDTRRLTGVQGAEHLGFLDLVMGKTCSGMDQAQYRHFLEKLYTAYSGNMRLLKSILSNDLRALQPDIIAEYIHAIETECHAKILAIAGSDDPWDDPAVLTSRNKTMMRIPNAGHWTHITHTQLVADAIQRFRHDKPLATLQAAAMAGEPQEDYGDPIGGF